MAVIKAILREELRNAVVMKSEYEKALSNLPEGALFKKMIKNREYWYLISRKDKKVHFKYMGKLDKDKINEYNESKKLRAKYRSLLSQVKIRIKYLKGVLRGKREI